MHAHTHIPCDWPLKAEGTLTHLIPTLHHTQPPTPSAPHDAAQALPRRGLCGLDVHGGHGGAPACRPARRQRGQPERGARQARREARTPPGRGLFLSARPPPPGRPECAHGPQCHARLQFPIPRPAQDGPDVGCARLGPQPDGLQGLRGQRLGRDHHPARELAPGPDHWPDVHIWGDGRQPGRRERPG